MNKINKLNYLNKLINLVSRVTLFTKLTAHSKTITIWGYTLVYRLRLNENLEYTKYRQKYIESEYISHFGRK